MERLRRVARLNPDLAADTAAIEAGAFAARRLEAELQTSSPTPGARPSTTSTAPPSSGPSSRTSEQYVPLCAPAEDIAAVFLARCSVPEYVRGAAGSECSGYRSPSADRTRARDTAQLSL